MGLQDAQRLGAVGDLIARVRLGRERGLSLLAGAGLFEEVFREAVDPGRIGDEDNVILLGGIDERPVLDLAPRCRMLEVMEDLPEDRLASLEAGFKARGHENVRVRHWRSGDIPVPQGTTDCVISMNFLYRCKDPAAAFKDIAYASHHGCRIIVIEPAASLDDRTARKYSREAELSMEDHEALVSYARSACALRRFTREGLEAMMTGAGLRDVKIREALHGLVLAAQARMEY